MILCCNITAKLKASHTLIQVWYSTISSFQIYLFLLKIKNGNTQVR